MEGSPLIAPLALAAAVAIGPAHCDNSLATTLHSVGFRGQNLKEAWAIAMRESGGRASAISSTQDYGLFQFNRAAWHKAHWWDPKSLLQPKYNATVAFRVSKGGKTWYPWDLSGKGEHLGRYSPASVGQKFQHWLNKFPATCKGLLK